MQVMKVRDVMISPVITVKSSATLKEVARLMMENGISALPVVDDHNQLVGIISEGDLLHRAEIGTERRRSNWVAVFDEHQTLATDYIRAHATKVVDVMTRSVVTATPDTPLHELATTMETHAVKRVPIVGNGALVGIVSRANLVQAFATAGALVEISMSDKAIRDNLMERLKRESWSKAARLNAIVNHGVVSLWGQANSDIDRKAIRIAAEATPGVVAVNDHIVVGRVV
jgi:CBS-domain-containing membrane protein